VPAVSPRRASGGLIEINRSSLLRGIPRDFAKQLREFFASTTTLRTDALGRDSALRLLQRLHLTPLLDTVESERAPLLILRHTIMNPFLLDAENGVSYIDRYFVYLSRHTTALLDGVGHRHVG
jgi:hypothetical protein